MSLWTCIECGAQAIAHSLGFCPQCFKPREEAEMPKITASGGATNGYEPESVAPEPADEEAVQDGPETAQDAPVDPGTASEPRKPAPDALSELEAAAAALKRPAKAETKQDG